MKLPLLDRIICAGHRSMSFLLSDAIKSQGLRKIYACFAIWLMLILQVGMWGLALVGLVVGLFKGKPTPLERHTLNRPV